MAVFSAKTGRTATAACFGTNTLSSNRTCSVLNHSGDHFVLHIIPIHIAANDSLCCRRRRALAARGSVSGMIIVGVLSIDIKIQMS